MSMSASFIERRFGRANEEHHPIQFGDVPP
jgi:hypothetical protein